MEIMVSVVGCLAMILNSKEANQFTTVSMKILCKLGQFEFPEVLEETTNKLGF
jgi:hypothetical protein